MCGAFKISRQTYTHSSPMLVPAYIPLAKAEREPHPTDRTTSLQSPSQVLFQVGGYIFQYTLCFPCSSFFFMSLSASALLSLCSPPFAYLRPCFLCPPLWLSLPLYLFLPLSPPPSLSSPTLSHTQLLSLLDCSQFATFIGGKEQESRSA